MNFVFVWIDTNPIHFNVLRVFEDEMVHFRDFKCLYHRNHQSQWNVIPYFVYLLKMFGFTWSRAYLGKVIGHTSFNQRYDCLSLSRSMSFIGLCMCLKKRNAPCLNPLKLFRRNEYKKKLYFMMWNTQKVLLKIPNHFWMHTHTHTYSIHIL